MADETKTADDTPKSALAELLPELHDDKGNFSYEASMPTAGASAAGPGATTEGAKPALDGEYLSAGVGALVGTKAPKYRAPSTVAARTRLAVADANLTTARSRVESLADADNAAWRNAEARYSAAKTAAQQTGEARTAAQQIAAELGLTEDMLNVGDLAGDKWSAKVVGDMGPGGNSVTEAARNYQIEKGLPPDYKSTRTGIAVPRSFDETPAQKQARKLYEYATAAHTPTQAEFEAAQAAFDAAAAKPAPLVQAESAVESARGARTAAQARVASLEEARSVLSKIPFFNTIMGGLSGYEIMHAYNAYKAGDSIDAILSGLSGVGGLVSLAPHPAAKAAGALMTTPALGYQLYQASKKPYDYRPNTAGGGAGGSAPRGALPVN
jgi:hypothetical protein